MKKGTTYEEMMKETQENNQMIVDAFNPNKNKMTQEILQDFHLIIQKQIQINHRSIYVK